MADRRCGAPSKGDRLADQLRPELLPVPTLPDYERAERIG